MLKICDVPAPELPSDRYAVTVDGVPAPAYRARVSRIPFDRVWPGHQRPMEQSELTAFLSFSTDRPVTVRVVPARPFREAVVRPLSKNIVPERDGDALSFTVCPGDRLSLELDGHHDNLQIFANRPAVWPTADRPGVRYFGPGTHDAGRICLRDGETLVIDDGAVVYGSVVAEDVRHVRICGYGILCNSVETRSLRFPSACLDYERMALPEERQSIETLPDDAAQLADAAYFSPKPLGCLNILRCDDVTVEGITFRDSSVWTATVIDSSHVTFDNVKTIGMWRYNADGIDFCNSDHGVVRRSFLRNFDDVIVVKGIADAKKPVTEELLFEDNVVWCDWGRGFEIGAETCAREIRHIVYRDSDILHGTYMHMDIQNGDSGHVHDVLYEDIRIEYSKYETEPILQEDDAHEYTPKPQTHMPYLFLAEIRHGFWNIQPDPGHTSDVVLRNIAAVTDPGLPMPPIAVLGQDDDHRVERVRFENVTVNGIPITVNDVKRNNFTNDIAVL